MNEREKIKSVLTGNKVSRDEAQAQLERHRQVLRDYLVKGHEAGLSVAEMARAAGIAHASASRIIHHGRSWQPRRAA